MSALLKSIEEHFKVRPEQAKLTETRLVSDFDPGEIRDTIEALYKKKDLNLRLFASILNSIFTQHRAVFLFSRPILLELLKKDPNLSGKRKTVNGAEFNNLMINLSGKYVERLRTPNKDEHKAAVYKLVDGAVLELLRKDISNDIISAQETQCIDIFNSYDKTSRKTSTENSSGNGNEYGNDLSCLTEKVEKKEERVTSPNSPQSRIEELNVSEVKLDLSGFTPDPELPPETVEHQKILVATAKWSQEMSANYGDYKKLLMGKTRRKVVSSYVACLKRSGCNLADGDAVRSSFDSAVLRTWLKKDTEQNRVLRKEVADEIAVRVFEVSTHA